MTTQQAYTLHQMLLRVEDEATFVGAEIRPANESDSVYDVAVSPAGADVFAAIGVVDDEGEERTFVSVINPNGAVIINYET